MIVGYEPPVKGATKIPELLVVARPVKVAVGNRVLLGLVTLQVTETCMGMISTTGM